MNDDLISRKAAIEEFWTNGSATVYGIQTCEAIISRLKMVPPALPAQTPCDLCVYDPPSSGDGKPCSMCPATAK